MGLAASQARLLSITTRKSDCEYQSMRLSHQKISLSRDMTAISNEYQASLNQTKLVYDFYGTGDTSTQLSYGLMMTPSILNNNLPMLLTNAEGRVVLDSKYAAAARAAGIPQEGVSGFPSSDTRNAFLAALEANGIINTELAESLQNVSYNQTFGVGTTPSTTIITQQGNIDALKERLLEASSTALEIPALTDEDVGSCDHHKNYNPSGVAIYDANGKSISEVNTPSMVVTIYDLLNDEENYVWWAASDHEGGCSNTAQALGDRIRDVIIPWLNEELASILDIGDPNQAAALDYAMTETMTLFGEIIGGENLVKIDEHGKFNDNLDEALGAANTGQSFGYVYSRQNHTWVGGLWSDVFNAKNKDGAVAVNLSNIVDAYLTFFADSLGNLESKYNIAVGGSNSRAASNVVTDDEEYLYTFKVGSDYSSANLEAAQFYDTLFNMLCNRGWIESGKDKTGVSLVNDPEYVQEMLQNGMMYLTTCETDGYYYQGNYSTNSYIKEIADESAIALAEAKYQNEKQKINSKEETIDMKMKNLDTEISSLTTEYDTVKSVISKNIEKSFKRYQA